MRTSAVLNARAAGLDPLVLLASVGRLAAWGACPRRWAAAARVSAGTPDTFGSHCRLTKAQAFPWTVLGGTAARRTHTAGVMSVAVRGGACAAATCRRNARLAL